MKQDRLEESTEKKITLIVASPTELELWKSNLHVIKRSNQKVNILVYYSKLDRN